MKTLFAALMLITSVAFAAPMGDEAIEMAGVISHPQVKECLGNVNIGEMINVTIEKRVARCPMCNTYIITGREIIQGDIISSEVTTISIVGKGVQGFGEGFAQTYKCTVSKK